MRARRSAAHELFAARGHAGAGIGLVNALGGTAVAFGEALGQTACTVPAVWLLVGLATAVVGARPTLRPLRWAGIVAAFGITLLGPTFRFPDWAMSISPMGHVPNITADDAPWTGLLVVGGIALALLAVGFVGFGRRDVR